MIYRIKKFKISSILKYKFTCHIIIASLTMVPHWTYMHECVCVSLRGLIRTCERKKAQKLSRLSLTHTHLHFSSFIGVAFGFHYISLSLSLFTAIKHLSMNMSALFTSLLFPHSESEMTRVPVCFVLVSLSHNHFSLH